METVKKVARFIETHRLLSPGDRVLVGVSGGADSVALLHILAALDFECVVAHCNFHLRADESERDERFVRELASSGGLAYHRVDFDTAGYARSNKMSIEMAARHLRYTWFERLSAETGCVATAVAHHADDSAETLLLNLIRGTGLKGLTGIAPGNGNIVRPLLCIDRAEVEAYVQKHHLSFVVDSSNATTDYVRNKIRNVILPLMSEINPSVKRTLAENAERLQGVWGIYVEKITEVERRIAHVVDGQYIIDLAALKQHTEPQTVLYELLHPFGFHAAVVSNICQLSEAEVGARFYSASHRALKDRCHLIVDALTSPVVDLEHLIEEHQTEIESPIRLAFKKTLKSDYFSVSKSAETVHVDADKLRYPLLLRRWQVGDAFVPFGMRQSKKLSDFFVDEKLNRNQKEAVWLLVSSSGEIIWVIGLRLDNRFRITDTTKNVLEITVG